VVYDESSARLTGMQSCVVRHRSPMSPHQPPSSDDESNLIALLAQSGLFRRLGEGRLRDIVQVAHRRAFAAEEIMVRQGDPALACYVLVAGHARIVQVTPGGHAIVLRFIGPPADFGLVALLSDAEYPATVQAVEPCEVLLWEGELLAQFVERESRMAFNAIRVLARQHQEQQVRYQELLTEAVEQRLARALVRLVGLAGEPTPEGTLIALRLSREDLADLVGSTLFTVSRILSRWDHEGIVDSRREAVEILDMERLRTLSVEGPSA
jgi:CRP-like cAMP-binding protein